MVPIWIELWWFDTFLIDNMASFVSLVVPPAYDPNAPQGYPPQQPGYPPQQQGYGGYPPPTQGYAPAPAQQQTSTNVVVVGGAPAQQTTIIQQPEPHPSLADYALSVPSMGVCLGDPLLHIWMLNLYC